MSRHTYKVDLIAQKHAEVLQRYAEQERLRAIWEAWGDGSNGPLVMEQKLVAVTEEEMKKKTITGYESTPHGWLVTYSDGNSVLLTSKDEYWPGAGFELLAAKDTELTTLRACLLQAQNAAIDVTKRLDAKDAEIARLTQELAAVRAERDEAVNKLAATAHSMKTSRLYNEAVRLEEASRQAEHEGNFAKAERCKKRADELFDELGKLEAEFSQVHAVPVSDKEGHE